ncbi:hypothetical protein SAMD00019534_005330 [Acytostelium subglobosum LB1]|uniref:hypothetical protein n=1 Tax=Acytostelium subglobosum LB1 TaxID=1410327 RepID=UPI0006447ADC|nr:hypothetical protein SAMD00019534_005330 [Acytostelium subglobosum LB1]GAM17358.1 hypothetical protein SAMD00019534_005330 [Acytostelium subglobosum LB1]|eukprot:XP_012759420.1 hypothetical protein SAMD00019534_005330 [Acytostelium subglobosum LB1]
MITSNNLSSPVEILIDHCRRIQAETDTFIQQVDIYTHHSEFNDLAIDNKFNYAIKQYNTSIEIIENILKNDPTLCDRLADFLEYSVVTRNQIIQTKASMLDQQLENTDCEALLSLSRVTVYRWRVHHDLLKQTHDYEQSVERQTVGVGELHLLRASDLLHILELKVTSPSDLVIDTTTTTIGISHDDGINLNRSLDHLITIDTDTNREVDIRFPLARETPIFLVARGNYILQLEDYYYGVMLPFDIPDQQQQQDEAPTTALDGNINQTTDQTSSDSLSSNNTNTCPSFAVRSMKSMSTSIDNGGQNLTNGIMAASSMISLGLRGGGFYLKSTLARNNSPTVVSPMVAGTIGYIRSATPYASKGSSYLITKLSEVVEVVGTGIYSGIKTLMPAGGEGGPSPTMEAATQLGATSIKAISSISSALSEGLSTIVEEATGTTVDVVQHRYGKHMANLTHDTLNISKDVVNTALNLQMGSAKAFAIKALTEGGGKIAAAQSASSSSSPVSVSASENSNDGGNDDQDLKRLQDQVAAD